MSGLADGTYDIFIVDAREDAARGRIDLDLTITRGEMKGEVVSVSAPRELGEELDLLGMPGRLDVVDGQPRVTVER
jgi:hypothetical protein